MKNKALVFCFLAALTSLSGCDELAAKTASNPDDKVLHMGTFGVSIGFSVKKSDTDIEGYDIDVANAVAKKLGYTSVQWSTADMTGLFGMLDSGKIVSIANQVEINDKRKEKYLFTQPYIYSGAQLLVREDDNSINSIDDLKGKKLGVDLGSSKESFLKKNYPDSGITITTYDDPSSIIQDVALKRVDAYIMDHAASQLLITASRLPLKQTGKPVYVYKEAFPFVNNAKGQEMRDKFDKALKDLQDDGTLTKLSEKWLKQDVSKG